MLFVTNRPKLVRAIAIIRDDRTRSTQFDRGSYVRMEANDSWLTILADKAGASVPATVYEPGVLFLHITLFRRLLKSFVGQDQITIQVTDTDLLIENVKMPLYGCNMLLYPDPAQAPRYHPFETMRKAEQLEEAEAVTVRYDPGQLLLFDDLYQ